MINLNEEPLIAGLKSIKQEVEPGIYAWCSCGWSSSQPFCDGSHKGTNFKPFKLKVEERRKISWCNCKHTQKPPFCDGTHKTLPGFEPPVK
jgi:CDGSH-type Zn-finger protein